MNKKGEVSIAVWIIIVVAGLFLAHQTGLFEIFTPDIGQPAGTDSLVNKIYYPAINIGSGPCQESNQVYFRTTDLNYEFGSAVAYSHTPSGNLIAYGKTTGACTSERCENNDYDLLVPSSSGDIKFWYRSSTEVCICNPIDTSGYSRRYDSSDSDASKVSLSKQIIESSRELYTSTELKDPGIYSKSEGNIVMRYCGSFGDELVYNCPLNQPAEFLTNFQTPDGLKDIVKCSGSYIPNKNLCVDNILYTTNNEGTSLTSKTCGYICSNEKCIDCQDGNKRCVSNKEYDIEICSGGQWTEWISPDATCIGEQQCVNGVCTSDISPGMKRCNGKQPQVFTSGYTWQNDGEACDIQCNELTATEVSCTKECEPIGYYCVGGELYDCQPNDRDNDKIRIGSCVSGYCTSDNSKCFATREIGDKYCSGNEIFKAVSSGNEYDLFGGVKGDYQATCKNSCVPEGDNSAKCTKIEGCDGNEGLSICLNGFERVTCSDDSQSYTTYEDCTTTFSNGFCELKGGVGVCSKPEDECIGTILCSNGKIRACNDGVIGNVIWECNGLGCQTLSSGLPICVDECSILDEYKCINQDSYVCTYDELTPSLISQRQKILELVMECSSEGCDPSTGKCISSGTPNTYICMGEDRNEDGRGDDIWFINENGFLDSLIDQCGVNQDNYCSEGLSYCKFCEQSYISCSPDGKRVERCKNEKTGEVEVLDTCEVGCFVEKSKRYCDDLKVIISESQNFLVDEPVSIKGLIKGSESDKGIIVPKISVKLEGPGETITETGASGASGNFDVNFGKKSVGDYIATLDMVDYNKQYIISVKVTNDFIIKLYGSQVLTTIPGTTPSTELEVVGGTGEPEDIVDVGIPEGLESIEVTKTGVSGRWKLQVKGEPGIYQIKLAAVENGVILEPYTISIELRKPKLEITTNIPSSGKIGENEYEIKILAPQIISGLSKTDSIQPDSITLTINGESYDLSSKSLGNGRYLFDYDYTEGTYTINLEAELDGYQPVSISKQLQISKSGTDLPPSSGGTGDDDDDEEDDDGDGEPKPPIDTKTIIILAILGIGGYFLFKKK